MPPSDFWAGFGLCYIMAAICVGGLVWAEDPDAADDSSGRLMLIACAAFWPVTALAVVAMEPRK